MSSRPTIGVSTARRSTNPHPPPRRPQQGINAVVTQGKEGICCVKTKQAILVAHYPETVQPGEAAKVAEALADYLIGVGY